MVSGCLHQNFFNIYLRFDSDAILDGKIVKVNRE